VKNCYFLLPNVRGSSCKSNGTSSFGTMTLLSPLVCRQSLSQSGIAATLFLVTSPGCKSTFQHTRHSTATSTYRCNVHQVANGVIAQAVPATDGLTRFGGSTTSHQLTSGGVMSIVVSAGRRYCLYWLSVNDDAANTYFCNPRCH